MKMLLGRDGTQSFVYRVNKNGENTHSCRAPVFMTSVLVRVVDLDSLSSVSEKRVVPSYQYGVDFHVVHFAK